MRRFTRLSMVSIAIGGLLLGSAFIGAEEPEKEKPEKETARQEEKAEGKADAVAPVRRIEPVDLGEQLGEKNPEVLSWMFRLRPVVRAEYHVIVRVCEPTDEQRRKLAETFAESVRATAKRWLEQMRQPNGFARNQPEKIVPPLVVDFVKPILSAEQIKRYQADIETRKTQYREAASRSIVAALDQEMRLSAEQRDQIREALRSNWDEEWVHSLQVFDYGLRFFPNIPDKYVEPYLDEAQKAIWRSIDKSQSAGFGFESGVNNQALEDDLRQADQPEPEPTTQPD